MSARIPPAGSGQSRQNKTKEGGKMAGEIHKVITVNGKLVYCIDEIDGFILKIDGQKYHVYADEDGTHVDQILGDERECIGKVNDFWTGDEEEAARFILSFWNGD